MAKEKQQAPVPMSNGAMQTQEQDMFKNLEMMENILREKHTRISNIKTPKTYTKKRPDGYDYVDEAYMRHQLNKLYPVWSWEIDSVEFLGSEWVYVRGHLVISDSSIQRKFGAVGATRVQFKRNKQSGEPLPHTHENVVDIDKNVATANTNAFKRSVNRLCNIADDIYKKNVVDISLTKEQKLEMNALLEDCSDKLANQIAEGIEDLSINTYNFDKAKERIIQIQNEKEKGDKDE